jgi:hypothetical protein
MGPSGRFRALELAHEDLMISGKHLSLPTRLTRTYLAALSSLKARNKSQG